MRSRGVVPAVLVLALVGACGDSGSPTEPISTAMPATASSAIVTTVPASTTTASLATTTTTSTTTTSTTTTSTTTTSTTTTTTTIPAAEVVAAGTLQVGIFDPTGEAQLPEPPFDMSVVIRPTGTSNEFSFTFDDPDPGWVEGDLIAMTTATFALAMTPGEYNIDVVSIADAAAPGEPTELWLGPVWGMSPGPKFTVPAEGECVFMGQITLAYFRLPAGDVASQLALLKEITAGAEVSVQLDPEGTYLFQGVGLDLFADEGELALPGKRWFHDGDEIDVSSCVDLPAEF